MAENTMVLMGKNEKQRSTINHVFKINNIHVFINVLVCVWV